MILIIDRKETIVRHASGSLLIERPDEPVQRVPINLLQQVIVYGSPLIEAGVWRALTAAGVAAMLLPARGQQDIALLAGGLSTRLPLRRQQHRCADDSAAALAVARWFVDHKLAGYDLALDHFDDPSDARPTRFVSQRDEARRKLDAAESINALMGLEGATANAWFALLAQTLPEHWRFSGRNRQPPRDPVNALLSLSYTLVGSDVRQVLIGEGLDPALGFLHQYVPSREALVLDFIELFRGAVDRFVLGLLPNLKPKDFTYSEQDGCRLTKTARPAFYSAWAEARESWPKLKTGLDDERLTAHVQEQIRGRVYALRELLDTLKKSDDE